MGPFSYIINFFISNFGSLPVSTIFQGCFFELMKHNWIISLYFFPSIFWDGVFHSLRVVIVGIVWIINIMHNNHWKDSEIFLQMFNNPSLWSVLTVNACFFSIYIIEINTWLSVFSPPSFFCDSYFMHDKILSCLLLCLAVLIWVSCVCNDCFLHEDYEMSYKLTGCGNKKKRGASLAFLLCWICQ